METHCTSRIICFFHYLFFQSPTVNEVPLAWVRKKISNHTFEACTRNLILLVERRTNAFQQWYKPKMSPCSSPVCPSDFTFGGKYCVSYLPLWFSLWLSDSFWFFLTSLLKLCTHKYILDGSIWIRKILLYDFANSFFILQPQLQYIIHNHSMDALLFVYCLLSSLLTSVCL